MPEIWVIICNYHGLLTETMDHLKPLDATDRRILAEIQRDGRAPIVDLADRIALSKSSCLDRLRRLERDGYIRGYRADLDPQKIEQGYLVYVEVKLESTVSQMLQKFNAAVKRVPQILSCHMMSGGFDYLLKVRTRDMHAYRELLGDVIAELPGVQQTSTYPVMEEVKETSLLLVDEGGADGVASRAADVKRRRPKAR